MLPSRVKDIVIRDEERISPDWGLVVAQGYIVGQLYSVVNHFLVLLVGKHLSLLDKDVIEGNALYIGLLYLLRG